MKPGLIWYAFVAITVVNCPAATLEEVARFPNQQATGVAVSKDGRVFVNFPDWSDDHTSSSGNWHPANDHQLEADATHGAAVCNRRLGDSAIRNRRSLTRATHSPV
jgi:hypothetical protein